MGGSRTAGVTCPAAHSARDVLHTQNSSKPPQPTSGTPTVLWPYPSLRHLQILPLFLPFSCGKHQAGLAHVNTCWYWSPDKESQAHSFSHPRLKDQRETLLTYYVHPMLWQLELLCRLGLITSLKQLTLSLRRPYTGLVLPFFHF